MPKRKPKRKANLYKELMRWKKKHLKYNVLSTKDGETLQRMAIDGYMAKMISTTQFDTLISETIISGRVFSFILDEIRAINTVFNSAFKTYAQRRKKI